MKNLAVVTTALRMLGVMEADEVNPSPEDGALGLEQMNDLLVLLVGDGIDLGFPPQDDLQDDFPLDDTVAAQIKPLLAVHLHQFYPNAVVSPGLASAATLAASQLRRTAVLENIEEADLRHIPLGEAAGRGGNILTGE